MSAHVPRQEQPSTGPQHLMKLSIQSMRGDSRKTAKGLERMCTWKYVVLCAVGIHLALAHESHSQAAQTATTLPGSQPLRIEKPIDEVMLEGIRRFALRALMKSPDKRGAYWNRDYRTPEAYSNSVKANRTRLLTLIGDVDERLSAESGFQLCGCLGSDSVVAHADDFTVYAVHWQALDGVAGEGLLLQPKRRPVARVVAVPDADWTPEQFCGIAEGLNTHRPVPRLLAENQVQVIVPTLLSRDDTFSGNPTIAYTNQPHREFIYRQAFPVGRHIIGYEVQKIQAAIDRFVALNREEKLTLPIGVVGVSEGGLLAFYTGAVDPRVDATMVSGYFGPREGIWREPIYRNLWGLLTEFGDAEIASLVAPRPLVLEACSVPEVSAPPAPQDGRRNCAAPGEIRSRTLSNVTGEYERAREHYVRLDVGDRITLVSSDGGTGPSGSRQAIAAYLKSMGIEAQSSDPTVKTMVVSENQMDLSQRQGRQVRELAQFTQRLVRLSSKKRKKFWSKADRSNLDAWIRSSKSYRNYVWEELIGRLPEPEGPPNVRTRCVIDDSAYTGYEIVLDVFPDVIAAGILLLPKDLDSNEKRPVVVCQHGLEGVPADTMTHTGKGYQYYHAFADELAKRGFIVYAPQNPYRGADRFRVIQRQSNPMKRSLFSYIVRQHEQTLKWLQTLPNVDPKRIGFYGLSYGGKTALRVPPILSDLYALSICSGDFNEWIRKTASVDYECSYVFTGEYEIPEWNMAHIASHAELAMLMAPRPFMIERGHDDGVAIDEWVAWEYAKVRRHYDQLGIGNRTEIEFFDGPHQIHGVKTYEFLAKHLDWPRALRD